MRRTLGLLLAGLLLLSSAPAGAAAAAGYPDVPAGSWAADSIAYAQTQGLMQGVGGGLFGYGRTITRAEFAAILCRMFDWETVTPAAASFSDVASGIWYYSYIETAAANGAVTPGGSFRPLEAITREEMAVLLVHALGYVDIAAAAASYDLPFTDLEGTDRGAIAVAYDIGMTTGRTATTFVPNATAAREEAATMLVRVHRRLVGKTDWFHGFYAISSYAQRAVTQEMDAVSAGWSRLTWSTAAGVVLNTSSSGGNEFSIPASYESITSYLEAGGTPLSLDVYASDSTVLTAVLTDEANRAAAVDAILAEATRTYDAIGKSPYAGVTIDFEGLRGETMKTGFTAFLTALSARLAPLGMTLYVTVQPATADGTYYDGYDYRAIGKVADRVILMAHDYNATSLSGFEGSSYYRTTALTPLSSVYYSLRAVCDAETGVRDRSKIALAVSFSSLAWKTEDGLLVSGTPLRPSTSTIYARLKQEGTVLGWSDTYRNPYAVYDADGQEIFLWYEDARSIAEKVKLARLFGITGVSVWRIGLIPDYDDAGLYYNALPALTD